MKPLTARQRQVLEILIRTTEEGCQASAREVLTELGLRHTNQFAEWIDALEARRFVRRHSTEQEGIRQRAVTILRNPDGSEYLTPLARYNVLCQALGCPGQDFASVLAVARAKRVDLALGVPSGRGLPILRGA